MNTTSPLSEALCFVRTKLQEVAGIRQPQYKFLCTLFGLFWTIPHRVNFLMMGRYGSLSEKTCRLHFGRLFDFGSLFFGMLGDRKGTEMLAVFDPSFIRKSGKGTQGLGKFWNGKAQKSEQGLEIGCLAMVDVAEQTAYHLQAVQTQATTKECNLVSQYVKMITDNISRLLEYTKYLAVDGYFMKKAFIDPLTEKGLHIITKMRSDANLRERYIAPADTPKKRGRKKTCGPKIDLKKMDKAKWTMCLDTPEMKGYELLAYCVVLRAVVKVVYLEKVGEKSYAILLSTDTELAGATIIKYYRLRFQIEFLLRDAKQFGGLEDCQARDTKKLNFHFNMALGCVSTAKLTMWSTLENKLDTPFSMHNVKQAFYNKHMAETIIVNLGLDLNCQKIKTIIHNCIQMGRIAA